MVDRKKEVIARLEKFQQSVMYGVWYGFYNCI